VELGPLIAASSLVVSTTSSALVWAIGIDRAAISAYFWEGTDEFKLRRHWSGVELADTEESLRAAIRNSVTKEAYREEWGDRRVAGRGGLVRVDGKRFERIVDQLGSLLSA